MISVMSISVGFAATGALRPKGVHEDEREFNFYDLKGDVEYNLLKPQKVTVPTLVMYGEHDPGVTDTDAAKFFAALATPDRQLVVLPGADHAAQLEDTHEMFMSVVTEFITRPKIR